MKRKVLIFVAIAVYFSGCGTKRKPTCLELEKACQAVHDACIVVEQPDAPQEDPIAIPLK